MNLICIAGVTCTGKTTSGKKLSEHLGIKLEHTDHAYNIIQRKIREKVPEAKALVIPENQKKYKNFIKLKKQAYENLLSPYVEEDLILEGFNLFFKEDREIIHSVLKKHTPVFLKLEPSYQWWVKVHSKKLGGNPNKSVYTRLNKYFEPPEKYYVIKNHKQLFTKYIEYQRLGLTDKKIKLLPLPASLTNKTVLDLGCSDGWIGEHCLKRGARRVVGVDKNWQYLKNASERGLDTRLMKLENIGQIKEKFDYVICLATAHYVIDKEKLFKNISRICKECFILELPLLKQDGLYLEQKKTHQKPTKDLVVYWLKKYFKSVEVLDQTPAPDNSYRLLFKAVK